MTGTRMRLGALVALLLLAGACSVSSSDESSDGTTTTPEDDTTTTTAPSEPAEPARGVTEDTIELGVALIDVDGVRDQFGVDLGTLPEGVVEALAAGTNADGGINGRMIEVVSRPFIPVGNESSTAACRELIEDEEVFAVLGMFLGDNGLCVTETYATPYIAPFGLDAQRQERSEAPFLSVEGEVGATNVAAVELFHEEGLLDDAKVAIYAESTESQDMVDEVRGALEDLGVEVVSFAQLPASGDPVQAATDIDRIFQRFQSEGADTLLALSGAAVVLPALERTEWSPQLLFTNGQLTSGDALDGFGLTDPSELEGARAATLSLLSEEIVDDPELAECIDTVNAELGTDFVPEDIFPAEEVPESQEIGQLVGVCQTWDLAVTALEAAGEHPTADSLRAGLEDLDEFSVAGRPNLSLGPDRWGADENVRLWSWDSESLKFAPAD